MQEDNSVGMFFGVDFAEYESWPGLRHSHLRILVERTPAHYRYACDHPEEIDTGAMRLGRAAHTAILEPNRFNAEYVCQPETYENAKGEEKPWHNGAAACKEWNQEQEVAGRAVLPAKDFAEAKSLAEAVRANDAAAWLLNGAKTEVSMRWIDQDTGLLLKGRLDIWKETGALADIKTTRCAEPGRFGRDAYNMGYLQQMVMYYDGARAASGLDVAPPILIAAEKGPPWAVAAYQVDDEENIELGRVQYRLALRKVQECMESGEWPGYSKELMSWVRPPWAGQEIGA